MNAVRQHHTALYGSHPSLLASAAGLYSVGMLNHHGLQNHTTTINQQQNRD